MTLDEAIKHAEEVAKENQRVVDTKDVTIDMLFCDDEEIEERLANYQMCADKHRQLAEWLKELKDYRERIPSYEAGYNDAKREIALSGEYERAYERGKQDAEQTRWIPVSEKLPEEEKRLYWVCTDTGYQCQCRWTNDVYGLGASDRWGWKILDIPQYQKVIAWMPLPAPFEPQESEGAEMTNRERIETYDNREFARFLASVAGYGGNKEEVDFWEDWLKAEKSEAESVIKNENSD